jgi:alpha-aminoadipic semialdehyde synthase
MKITDHMLAMKMIDKAHARGGRVQSFVSYCGGLPAPTAANNPLGYKFSWNPSGAIKAGRNPAVYLYQGKKVEVAGKALSVWDLDGFLSSEISKILTNEIKIFMC